jgi:hypothetical protein
MQAETSHAVQRVPFVGSEQLGSCLFVAPCADNCRSVVATARDAESNGKVLPPSWLDFFQDS